MHTPRPVEVPAPFYAGSFQPAVNLAEDLPHDIDADILLLGCGDVRHVLYLAHAELSGSEHTLDITACDVDVNVVARNLFLLTLILDREREEGLPIKRMWNMYYNLYLDEPDIEVFKGHASKLVYLSKAPKDWYADTYGGILRFCDEATLQRVFEIWAGYAADAEALATDSHRRMDFEVSLRDARARQREARQPSSQDVSRSCAPLAASMADKLLLATEQHWKTGFASSVPLGIAGPGSTRAAHIPNPIFAVPLLTASTLEYPTDPLLSFHLAPAHASLAEGTQFPENKSHVDQQDSSDVLLATSLAQFEAWVKSFRTMALAGRLIVRYTASDCFSLCYTLRRNLETGETRAGHYRARLGFDELKLNESDYGASGKAPKQFDVIDTSTLSDQVSLLNLLVSSGPLLKDAPASTLYTAGLYGMSDAAGFEQLLYGHATTISILLGLAPAEYWTNAKTVAIADQILTAWSEEKATAEDKEILPGFRLSWKQSKHMAGQQPDASLHADIDALVALAHDVYRKIFQVPSPRRRASPDEQKTLIPKKAASLHHHPGTVIAFLRHIGTRAQVDSTDLCERFLRSIIKSPIMECITPHLGAFAVEVPTLGQELAQTWEAQSRDKADYSQTSYDHGPMWWGRDPNKYSTAPPFRSWSRIPSRLAITLKVGFHIWRHLLPRMGHNSCAQKPLAGLIEGYLRVPSKEDVPQSETTTTYSDIQISFGEVVMEGSRDQDDFAVRVEEHKGDSRDREHASMIVSFYVPTAFVKATHRRALVGIRTLATALDSDGVEGVFDGDITECCSYALSDGLNVFITKYQPGQTGYKVTEGAWRRGTRNPTSPADDTKATKTTFTADFDLSQSADIVGITGRLDIASDQGKQLLADKAPIELHQSSPFTLDVILGKDKALTLPLTFPAPILKAGSKTRIARKSCYIEITAPLAKPSTFPTTLDDYFLPTVLPPTTTPHHPPTPLNTPHLNLNTLPILSLDSKSRISFITTLTSLMFSTRERALRAQTLANPDTTTQATNPTTATLSPSPRLNLKESLFTLFMLSCGLQGGQTGLFALSHPTRGGIHMLIFVSAVRLDAAHGSVVLDAAVLPFTRSLIEAGKLEEFLLLLRTLECCTLTVDDGELALWKKVLPAMVERCRDWEHKKGKGEEGCEYVSAGQVPVGMGDGEMVLCGCGRGRLPERFVALPEWETAARYATRVAISPVYASALVEELVAPELARAVAEEVQGKRPPKKACLNCGKTEDTEGVRLRGCARCLAVVYCSTECQKKDWKRHRMECEESDVHERK